MHGGGSSSGGRKKARIEIVPLIDVMFFLLASFMMVSLSLQKSQTIKVNPPQASQSLKDFKADVVSIGVAANGKVYLGTNLIDLPTLKTELARHGTNSPVFLAADESTRHGDVAAALRSVREAGFQRVAFVTSGGGKPIPPEIPGTRAP